ncbi:hypothetical protein [Mastigocoleus sp. MO_188.B34]|nr:hypothetical protein [Mastigocoleus sp. MO_188.B34]MDJ0697881.1 hypothetical protein [Mastigocoleus sp. MO_188.B34]
MEPKETVQYPPWYLEPYEGESISHYFGRYRRHETICPTFRTLAVTSS